jgi:hypothetical protein
VIQMGVDRGVGRSCVDPTGRRTRLCGHVV